MEQAKEDDEELDNGDKYPMESIPAVSLSPQEDRNNKV
jgi:hypothetical protein